MDHRQPVAMTRRHFLAAGAAAVTLAGLPAALGAADKKDDKADPFGGFTLGVQSYSFRKFNLEQAVKRIQDLGLHYVEFFQEHVPLKNDPDAIGAVQRLCKDHDITPIAYGVQGFTKDHDANKKIFEFGKALG